MDATLNPALPLGPEGPTLGAYKHLEGSIPSASTNFTDRKKCGCFGDVAKLEKATGI